uniref:CXXC-type zinc finger protein 1 n=1 Tax=Caenorhabditis japonica TaxID=281687 RepID=A0A8R1ICA7_CAEJA
MEKTIYESCLICGQSDVPLRKYAKHIELCWSRSEKAISFGAPERNNDKFYCEKFDARTNTYCKRLKSLCPEHKKPGPEQCLRICGYPKKWDSCAEPNARTLAELIELDEPFGDAGCMTKKESCWKHHKWLPALRGSIELEQACLYQKMFELCHETVKLNTHAEWTTNALSILMHKSTKIINHDDFSTYLKSQEESNAKLVKNEDRIMADAVKTLSTFSFQKEMAPEPAPVNAGELPHNQTMQESPTSSQKPAFSVSRLLE